MSTQLRLTEEQFAAMQRRRDGWREAVGDDTQPAKVGKYRAQPVVDADGIRHASKREAKRYTQLRTLLRAGQIQALARQVAYILPGGVEYRADFTYQVGQKTVIEDAKGVRTPEYKIKRRLMASIGLEITEV